MSRDFKQRMGGGFVSPKQPDLGEGRSWKSDQRHTFLSLTQNIQITNIAGRNDAQVEILSGTNSNNRVSEIKAFEWSSNEQCSLSFQNENAINTPVTKSITECQEQRPVEHTEKIKQIANSKHKISQQTKQIEESQRNTETKRKQTKAVVGLMASLAPITCTHQKRMMKYSFKCLNTYTNNIESLRMIGLFKHHCATLIQKNWRRHIAQHKYQHYKAFIHRFKPLFNAFQEGWKLRRILRTKTITKIVKQIKNRQALNQEREVRILKREVASEIPRLNKGSRWLSVKGQPPKCTKSTMPSKRGSEIRKIEAPPTSEDVLIEQIIVVSSTEGKTWEQIPIRPSKNPVLYSQSTQNEWNEGKSDREPPPKPKSKPKPKTKKILKSQRTIQEPKPQSILSEKDPKQEATRIQHSSRQEIHSTDTENIPKIDDIKGQSPRRQDPSNARVKQRGKSPKDKSKTSKLSLLQKRTKYDPRKAAEQAKIRSLLPQPQQLASIILPVEPFQLQLLPPIQELPPKHQPQSKRNIIPKEVSFNFYSNIKNQPPVTHQMVSPQPKSQHISLSQLEDTFNTAYSTKRLWINQQLSQLKRGVLNTRIPSMCSKSQFLKKYNPKYFNALEAYIIQFHQLH